MRTSKRPADQLPSLCYVLRHNPRRARVACKVGEVEPVKGPNGPAHCFSIRDEHGAPLLHIGYANEKVARDGKVAMEALLGNADFIASVNGNFH